MKVGRNDPCPCGSGKKYKRCHGAGTEAEKIIPFPGSEAGFDPFGGFGPRGMEPGLAPGGGPRPGPESRPLTYMESLGSPNLATDLLHELQEAIAGRSFATEAEEENFVRGFIEERNRRGREEFFGLSALDMQRLLDGDFDELGELLGLGGGLVPKDLPALPLLQSALALLLALEAGPLKATAAGYLPVSFVESWWKTVGSRRETDTRLREIARPRKEADNWDLLETRRLLETAGLVERRGPGFELAEEGRRILAEADFDALFRSLFIALGWEWDWNEFRDEMRAHDPLCEEGFVFCLYLLSARAREWVSLETLATDWLRAFPFLAETGGRPSEEALDWLRISLGISLVYWPLKLGLLEERGGWREYRSDEILPPHEVRVAPLFDRLIRLKQR